MGSASHRTQSQVWAIKLTIKLTFRSCCCWISFHITFWIERKTILSMKLQQNSITNRRWRGKEAFCSQAREPVSDLAFVCGSVSSVDEEQWKDSLSGWLSCCFTLCSHTAVAHMGKLGRRWSKPISYPVGRTPAGLPGQGHCTPLRSPARSATKLPPLWEVWQMRLRLEPNAQGRA